MGFPRWVPGLSGLIYLPLEGTLVGQKDRPYFIVDIDREGKCTIREGPMQCEAAMKMIVKLAEEEGKIAFGTPIEKNLQKFRSQGYLNFNVGSKAVSKDHQGPNQGKVSLPAPIIEKSNKPPAPFLRPTEDLPGLEGFDSFFDKLADEAFHFCKFQAQRPQQGNRIPVTVKRKVAELIQTGICFKGSRPGCFRIADCKKEEGREYSLFTYAATTRAIYPNYEIIVQIACFRDLVYEYAYSPDAISFEYYERVPPVAIWVDIGIVIPSRVKLFVEVKETKYQWEKLIQEVKEFSKNGVQLGSPDRGNDPLRKAKYIAAGRPSYFSGYTPDGFDSYAVVYEPDNRFTLKPAKFPEWSRL